MTTQVLVRVGPATYVDPSRLAAVVWSADECCPLVYLSGVSRAIAARDFMLPTFDAEEEPVVCALLQHLASARSALSAHHRAFPSASEA